MFSAAKWKNTVLSILFFLGLLAISYVVYEWYSSRVGVLDIKIENAVQAKKIIKDKEERQYEQIDSVKTIRTEVEKDIYKSVEDFYKQKENNLKKAKQDEKNIFNTSNDTSTVYLYLSNYRYAPIF